MTAAATWPLFQSKLVRRQETTLPQGDLRFSDVVDVESLIGRDTVDTIPPATLDAVRDHGNAQSRLQKNIDDASQVLENVARHGFGIDNSTTRQIGDGVAEVSAVFDTPLGPVERKHRARSAQHGLRE